MPCGTTCFPYAGTAADPAASPAADVSAAALDDNTGGGKYPSHLCRYVNYQCLFVLFNVCFDSVSKEGTPCYPGHYSPQHVERGETCLLSSVTPRSMACMSVTS